MIPYTNHLHIACDQQSLATNALTSPRSIGSPIDMSFTFSVGYDPKQMEKQCDVWLNTIRGDHRFTQVLDRYVSISFSERDQVLRDVYKYSFFKTFNAMNDLMDTGFNFFGAIPTNSNVFYGHKMLFYTFLNYNNFSPSRDLTSNVYMERIITIDDNALKIMEEDDVYINSYNENYPGGLRNNTYERILSALSELDEVKVSTLSHQDDVPKNSDAYSLGSMAYTTKAKPTFYSVMEDSVATVTTSDSLTDHISKFWNLACFISIVEIPEQFSKSDSGSPYNYVRKRLVSDATLFAMVESITGINNRGMYSNYGTNVPGVGSSPLNPGPNGPNGGNGNNPIFGVNFNNNGGSNINFNPNGVGNIPDPSSASNRRENRALKKFVVDKANELGRALTSKEAKILLRGVAQDYFASILTSRRQKDLIDNLRTTGIVETQENLEVNTPFLKIDRKRGRTIFNRNREGRS